MMSLNTGLINMECKGKLKLRSINKWFNVYNCNEWY